MAAHSQQLQQRLAGSVWSQCRSWYRMDNGRIVALAPGFTTEYVKAVQRPCLAEYHLQQTQTQTLNPPTSLGLLTRINPTPATPRPM